jgi:hypothetical protein
MTSRFLRALATGLALAAFLYIPAARGQALSATLVGNITDTTGASIPGATVTALHSATGRETEASTGPAGLYSFTTLPPGSYDVIVTADGFQTFRRRGVLLAANTTVRVDARLQLGQVSEAIEVSAQAYALQTDSAVVRNEIRSEDLQNVPVPVTRNYQSLLVTIPGISPPRDAHSLSANPSRALALNSNGTTAQSTAVRVDGATTWNSWLPHIAGYVPALEAIETVSVETGSYEAELGFAGGAAVNVQIKSGGNEVHGSGFWYHNNQNLKARPYCLPATQGQAKRILNQYGGTIGGPIVRNRLFYFVSYEGTPDRQSSFVLANVPTDLMRAGNFSQSPLPIYDPLTGAQDGSGRTPFAGNLIPANRISPITKRIADLTPSPNLGAPGVLGANLFANGAFAFDRHTIDTKFNAQVTEKLNLSARLSYLDWQFENPPVYGQLGGRGIESRGAYDGLGFGDTLTMTYSAVYTVTPTVVIDGYAGYTLIDNRVENIRLDENLGLDFLGIPGTNGPTRADGGWPGFVVQGFDSFGRSHTNSPWKLSLPQGQYVANVAWLKGKHDVRAGWNGLQVAIDSLEPWGHPGFFTFNRGLTGTPGVANNDFNSYAGFLLGLPSALEKRLRTESGRAGNFSNSLYVRDKWQATSKLTLSLGLRWEHFGIPYRSGSRGLEIYNFDTNQLSLCGLGNLARNCGFSTGTRYFAPRLGVAYRMTDTFVVRTGYGITWDPVNIGRNPAQTYPVVSTANFPSANAYQFVSRIEQGIPAVAPPDVSGGVIPMPNNVSLELADPDFRRSYIQSWNFNLQKEFAGGWIGEAGYVANRQLNLQNRWNTNYGFIGGGTPGMVLNQRFGRNATTNFFTHQGGFRGSYDSLQTTLNRRFHGGYMMRLAYTWSKAIGPNGNWTGVDGYANNNPLYWPIIARVPQSYDRTHNFNLSFGAELPFGTGKRWATSGVQGALLGGWQFNGLFTAYTGAPFTVSADGASLNAPGNSQIADQIKPEVSKVGARTQWFDTSAYAPVTAVRFGNSGHNQLRGPGLVNLDLSIYRAFRITERLGLQLRAEAFNVSNTPHFANPNGNVNAAQFGVINGVANTGREGIDERMFRLGLRLSF